jgi:CAAX prenyl protease-like protein
LQATGIEAPAASAGRHPTIAFTAPFAAYVLLSFLPPAWGHPLRLAVGVVLLLVVSRPHFSIRPLFPLASVALGAVVFAIWIAPDFIFGYRHHWVFENALVGRAQSSIPVWLRGNAAFLAVRTLNCLLVVPVVEELFWRGWLMRWMVDTRFLNVPLGACVPQAFWLTALLFGAEHGPYWEVGILAGIAYNWWIIRTRSLADCMLAHAVTNGLLSAFVLMGEKWQYWL